MANGTTRFIQATNTVVKFIYLRHLIYRAFVRFFTDSARRQRQRPSGEKAGFRSSNGVCRKISGLPACKPAASSFAGGDHAACDLSGSQLLFRLEPILLV